MLLLRMDHIIFRQRDWFDRLQKQFHEKFPSLGKRKNEKQSEQPTSLS
jgi:hypothetical protein